jgi:hypothetical protein
MSIAITVKARNQSDLINEGARIAVDDVQGAATDAVVLPVSDERALIVTGFTLSTDEASPIRVSLGFKDGTDPTATFWTGFVSQGGPVVREYAAENWYRGALGHSVVITTTGNVAFTLDMKTTSWPAELGYLHRVGAEGDFDVAHSSRAIFPSESGDDRGQHIIPGF